MTTYTYTVVAVDIVGNPGPASGPCKVTTLYTSQPVTGNKIIAYPNPCRRSVNPMIYFVNLPEQSTIWIYNITANLVSKLANLGSQAGWNVSGIAPGTYVYVVKSPQGKQKGKVCVLK